ncbi:MAG TPA: TAT-variant-translocated molybdopterin oxidoreductase [Pirellulales bacterium]|jgi:molybdopterin-containing oxidoreductase family iron-sulfur binding subunit|nr:TAT-variant-translocated molybdopterin oxidoreductase [Pirellulales bacterium]
MSHPEPISDFAAARLRAKTGSAYWRCLEELTEEAEFQEWLRKELPSHWNLWAERAIPRRKFLAWIGASLALAGLQGCSVQPPEERIFPYVHPVVGQTPGVSQYFATSMTLGGYATGLLVESHEGRPTKIEGNRDHPASLGATDIYAQAAILDLYDPDRSQAVSARGQTRSADDLQRALDERLALARKKHGAGLRLLTEHFTSPTLAAQMENFLQEFPEAKWHRYEPIGRQSLHDGLTQAYGRPLDAVYDFTAADVIVSLEADFLNAGPGHLVYARQFAARRRLREIAASSAEPSGSSGASGSAGSGSAAPGSESSGSAAPPAINSVAPAEMNRLYAVESTPSLTGAKADHRWPLAARAIEALARDLLGRLGAGTENAAPQTNPPPETVPSGAASADSVPAEWLAALAADLRAHRGRSLIVAGEQQPAPVHALAAALNEALGNVGQTVRYIEPVEVGLATAGDLATLASDLAQRHVDTLLILGGNPVFTAPVDLAFAEKLAKARFSAHLSLYEDETAALCDWHIPQAHFLETWSDARAFDGASSIAQPLIAPLYAGQSIHTLLERLSGPFTKTSYELVRAHWSQDWKPAADRAEETFETFWQQSVHDGVVASSASAAATVEFRAASVAAAAPPPEPSGLEIVFRPDATLYDGRFANNGWLQELPKPLTKLTWDNVALISPKLAEQLGLSTQPTFRGGEHGEMLTDTIELRYGGRALTLPVWILPGQAENSVCVQFGAGRTRGGRVAQGVGANVYALRTSDAPWFAAGLVARKASQTYPLACTQAHHQMENRQLIRTATRDEFLRNPRFATTDAEKPTEHGEEAAGLTLYPTAEHPYDGYKWGMAIDLSACVGCNACVIACQAENNIPVVGKDQVMAGREMHWIRIDRFYHGSADRPRYEFQPVPCMQCENAPCELVCPVGATVHSSEGLNDMVYNRCVGTRYCSNNCPYKVRRFNFLQYADFTTASLKLLHNPEVTVRSRGVMEKCTYCVQRITKAKIQAERDERTVRDGEIQTACQAACPSQAIVFGDLNNPRSEVNRWKETPLNYALLAELNTRPRTTYLAAVSNPNPAIKDR